MSPQTDWPVRRLRVFVPIVFAGLLILMIGAGLGALRALRQLHDEEGAVRKTLLARGQSLSTLCTSLDVYGDRIQRFILNPALKADGVGDFTHLDSEIDGMLRDFPGAGAPEEREMFDHLTRLFSDERRILHSVRGWSPDLRRRDGPRVLTEEVLPRGEQILSIYERVTIWNREQLDASDHRILTRFEELQGDLARLLLLALGAGLVLSIGSGVYIFGLEKQGRRQYAELAQSKSEMERLSARLVDAQEAERRTISRELHDEVGQQLGAVLVDIGRLSSMLPSDNPALNDSVARIKNAAETTVRTVRDISLLLRPSMLDDLGLIAALEWQGREISRHGDMEVEVEAHDVTENLPDDYRICIYRLVQEALQNASRHAAAKNARVSVEQTADAIEIRVRDDGQGFDAQRTRGLGILGMEERIKRLGGTLSITSAAGRGTVVYARLPRPRETSA